MLISAYDYMRELAVGCSRNRKESELVIQKSVVSYNNPHLLWYEASAYLTIDRDRQKMNETWISYICLGASMQDP